MAHMLKTAVALALVGGEVVALGRGRLVMTRTSPPDAVSLRGREVASPGGRRQPRGLARAARVWPPARRHRAPRARGGTPQREDRQAARDRPWPQACRRSRPAQSLARPHLDRAPRPVALARRTPRQAPDERGERRRIPPRRWPHGVVNNGARFIDVRPIPIKDGCPRRADTEVVASTPRSRVTRTRVLPPGEQDELVVWRACGRAQRRDHVVFAFSNGLDPFSDPVTEARRLALRTRGCCSAPTSAANMATARPSCCSSMSPVARPPPSPMPAGSSRCPWR